MWGGNLSLKWGEIPAKKQQKHPKITRGRGGGGGEGKWGSKDRQENLGAPPHAHSGVCSARGSEEHTGVPVLGVQDPICEMA